MMFFFHAWNQLFEFKGKEGQVILVLKRRALVEVLFSSVESSSVPLKRVEE
jgi:hypothetical protein